MNFRQILDSLLPLLPVGVVVAHDPQCRKVTLNAAAGAMLGVPPDASFSFDGDGLDPPFRMLTSGRALPVGDTPLCRAIAGGGEVRDERLEIQRPDGTVVQSTQHAFPLRDDDGTVVGGVCLLLESSVGRDGLRARNARLERKVADRTTEVQERAEQLRGLALALADAEARERKRLAQLLHDHFQQLISAAKLKAGLVRRTVDDNSARQNLEQIERLLDDAIAESRSLTSELSPPVLYDAGLAAALEALTRQFEKKHQLEVSFEYDSRAEPEVEQVRVLLFEAVRELLHNVANHADATRVSVALSLTPDGKVQIVVTDNGRGMDPNKLDTKNRAVRPFGLLEISERLNYIGGELFLRSAPGEGTEVRLVVSTELREEASQSMLGGGDEEPESRSRMPVTAAGADAAQARKLPYPRPRVADGRSKSVRILVADDHAMFRQGLITLLSQETAIEVVGEAADGEEAIALARELEPDILIVDISMPKLNGLQVTSQLSREMPHLKIVGLSMHEREDMARAMRAAGAEAYLTKGGSSEGLLGVLKQLSPEL